MMAVLIRLTVIYVGIFSKTLIKTKQAKYSADPMKALMKSGGSIAQRERLQLTAMRSITILRKSDTTAQWDEQRG